AASNRDELFMVRGASLNRAIGDGSSERDPSGMTAFEQAECVAVAAHAQADVLHRTISEDLVPALESHGVRLSTVPGLPDRARAWLARHFEEQVAPALTPLAIEADRPFPLLSGLSLNLGVLLEPGAEGSEPRLAVVQLPSKVPRLVRVAGERLAWHVLMEEEVRAGLSLLFPGQRVVSSAVFRVTRDAELEVDEEGGAA